MILEELQYETVYKYEVGGRTFYIYTYKTMFFSRKKASTQTIICLDKDFCTISQCFSLTGDFEEVNKDISEKVKGILGITYKQLFPIY